MTYKRVYTNNVRNWTIGLGLGSVSIILVLFGYLNYLGFIEIISHSGDSYCSGTVDDPCYAYINFTLKKDNIYIYPGDWYFYTDKSIKKIELQVRDKRTKSGWNKIDLTNKSDYCKKTGCGYAYNFYKSKGLWEVRFVGYKNNPNDVIKWGFKEIDPVWYPSIQNKFIINYG